MLRLGTTEILLILSVVILIFGPSKLPKLGKAFGQAIRNFKRSSATAEKPGDKYETEDI